MASPFKIELPPGFEKMSREEQVRYAQQLWDHVAPGPDDVPAEEWQIKQAETRLDAYLENPTKAIPWSEVKRRVRSKKEEHVLFQEQNRLGRSSKTIEQILEEQGIEPYEGSNGQVWPEDEDVEEFIAWRRRQRAASRQAQTREKG